MFGRTIYTILLHGHLFKLLGALFYENNLIIEAFLPRRVAARDVVEYQGTL